MLLKKLLTLLPEILTKGTSKQEYINLERKYDTSIKVMSSLKKGNTDLTAELDKLEKEVHEIDRLLARSTLKVLRSKKCLKQLQILLGLSIFFTIVSLYTVIYAVSQ